MDAVNFGQLEPSQCFAVKRLNKVFYLMKTQEYDGYPEVNAVNLQTARLHFICDDQRVLPIDVEMSFEV